MFTYSQSSGKLSRNGTEIGEGYSGAGSFKNDPAKQQFTNRGPIPQGNYQISSAILFTAVHGPFVLALTPDPANKMWGRSGFLIHGDSVVEPGSASQGCIILPRQIREQIAASGDHDLRVIA